MLRSFVRSVGSLKSSKDEVLLERLKYVNLQGGKTTTKPEVRPSQDANFPKRNLSLFKLSKVIKSHLSDPLQWNASVLSRVFNLPEDACEQLINYVQPMVHKVTRDMDEPEKLIKTSFVIDVGRLVWDKNYAPSINRIKFPSTK